MNEPVERLKAFVRRRAQRGLLLSVHRIPAEAPDSAPAMFQERLLLVVLDHSGWETVRLDETMPGASLGHRLIEHGYMPVRAHAPGAVFGWCPVPGTGPGYGSGLCWSLPVVRTGDSDRGPCAHPGAFPASCPRCDPHVQTQNYLKALGSLEP